MGCGVTTLSFWSRYRCSESVTHLVQLHKSLPQPIDLFAVDYMDRTSQYGARTTQAQSRGGVQLVAETMLSILAVALSPLKGDNEMA